MTQEEKARAYDKALDRARAINSGKDVDVEAGTTICEYIFPELAESEGEKIRKWIINEIKIKHHNLDEENVDFVDKAIAWLERQGEQKPEENKGNIGGISANWSEEDEKNLRRAIRATKVVYPVAADWLKSLKGRVQPQPKQGEQNLVLRDTFWYEDGRLFGMNEGIGLVLDNPEKYGLQNPVKWSKEDENVISLILSICNDFLESFEISPASTKVVKEDVDKVKNWLKSLRPQKQWKPSEDDIIILEKLIKGELNPKVFQATLQGILEKLKKLKEE